MKLEKVVGYMILAIGVAMILFSVYFMFRVFTGVSTPPELFHLSDILIPIPQPEGEPQNIQIISGGEMSRMTNMVFWYLLMLFTMWAGGKIGSLGVNLVREIRVELKQ